jgi:hypothetical protein
MPDYIHLNACKLLHIQLLLLFLNNFATSRNTLVTTSSPLPPHTTNFNENLSFSVFFSNRMGKRQNTSAKIITLVFWIVRPCMLVCRNQRFGETWFLRVRYQTFTGSIKMSVLWDTAPYCFLMKVSTQLRNVDLLQRDYMALYSRRLSS